MSRTAPRTSSAAGHTSQAKERVTSELELDDARVLLALCGPRNENLPVLEREARVDASVRGHTLLLAGEPADVALAERYLVGAAALAKQGVHVELADLGRALRMLRDDPNGQLSDMFDESIALGAGRRPIGPRGLAQKRYVEAIRSHDLTFGIGPAGTGKTYLAMACARVRAHGAEGEAYRPHAPGGGGGREARVPPWRSRREGEPVSPSALRRAQRHDGPRPRARAPFARSNRGGAARVHAREDTQRFLRDPGRGAEHHGGADAHVLDASRVQLEGGRHGRRHAGRPARGEEQRARRSGAPPRAHRRHRDPPVHGRGRRPAPARPEDRRRLRRARRALAGRGDPRSAAVQPRPRRRRAGRAAAGSGGDGDGGAGERT